jgi:error-prone DNA polymerase
VRGLVARRGDAIDLPPEVARERQPRFHGLSSGEAILWDYRTTMHSTHGHPIECIRGELRRRRLPDAEAIARMRDGTVVDYVGMVICRQRPATASGVTFFTLEDETGFVNLVVWRQVFERSPVLARTALLLGTSGKVQSSAGVVHVVAERLWSPEIRFRPRGTVTRSFH